MSFVSLHVKSQHSIGLGTASISELVERTLQYAGRANTGGIGLTDLENLRGQIELHAACRARGLQPISGVELRRGFEPGKSLGERSGRIVLLASDRPSYARLCQIVTQRRATSRCSSDPLSIVPSVCEGLFLLSDDPAVLESLVQQLGSRWVRALLVRPGLASSERELVSASRRLGVPLLADLDATLLDRRDAELQALLGAIHLGVPRASLDNAAEARVLLDRASADQLFADLPGAVRETRAVADACGLSLLEAAPRARRELEAPLQATCRDTLCVAGRNGDPRYAVRLNEELAAIQELGLGELFGAVAELMGEARRRSIPIAARGSVVSSLVGHLLGFSPVDPIEHGLYFERFASEQRRRPPDIDLDVSSRGREQLVDWLVEHQGPERAARLCALHGFGPRSALREGLKAWGVAPQEIADCLRSLPAPELGDDFRSIAGELRWPAGTQALPPLLGRLIGKPRLVALHPGGVVLGRAEQLTLIPLERSSSGALVSQYDARSISALGLCKVDLLGNRCLDEIEDATIAVSERAPECEWARAGGSRIPMADAATLSHIDAAQTIGCHQLESPALRAVLTSLPIRGLREVTHALAIVRPGPASGSAKEAFLARARGEAPALAVPGELAYQLDETYGMLLYEEDITLVLATLAGLSLAAADALRARLVERSADDAWLVRVGQRFRVRALGRGFQLQQVEALWEDVLRLGRYSFSRAHSASQAVLAYRAAFLRCHAPVEFGCAILNHHGGVYPRRVLAADLVRRGIELRPPSVLRGLAGCALELGPDGSAAIRVGVGLVKGPRAETRRALLAWQQARGSAPALEELFQRVPLRPHELEALLWSGALDELIGLDAGDYPWVHRALWGEWSRGQSALTERVIAEARQRIPTDPPQLVARYAGLFRVQCELRYLEMHLSDHPMRILREEADRLSCVTSDRLRQCQGRLVSFAGIVAATRNAPVAEGGAVQFMTFEDEHGLVEARLTPERWARLHPVLTTPGPYLLRGRVQQRQGALYLSVEELLPFHQRGVTLRGTLAG